MRCESCATTYAATDTQIDLRLRRAKAVDLPLAVGPLDEEEAGLRYARPIPLRPDGLTGVDTSHLAWGNGLTPELLSWFPRADGTQRMLELGCGNGRAASICRLTGMQYVSTDAFGEAAQVLARAEALPFRDCSFDFVFSLAVVAHTSLPVLTLHEVHRVLKPGARFVGTTQFLEPSLYASRHHVSSRGLQDWLRTADLVLDELEANRDWTAVHALFAMGYWPKAPARVKHALVRALDGLERLQTRSEGARAAEEPVGDPPSERFTGGFRFVAHRRPE